VAFPDGWGRRCALTIDQTLVDADLSDWTFILEPDSLPSEMLNTSSGNSCLDGGGDVRFSSDSAGTTRLACDIRACHPTAGGTGAYADIAVKVSAVSSTTDTTIYIWYEKAAESQPAVSDTYGQYNAYDANCKAVYPMHEDPSGSAPQMKNRKADSDHGTSAGAMTSGDVVDGSIYKALDFDGSNDYINCGDASWFDGASNITVECLYYPVSAASSALLTKWGTGKQIAMGFSGQNLYYSVRINGTGSGGSQVDALGSVSRTGAAWHCAAGTYDGATAYIYHNGAVDDSTAGSGTLNTTVSDVVAIAAFSNASSFNKSVMDEVRLSAAARSTAWLNADYYNLLDPTNFTTVGTPESPAGPSGMGYVNLLLLGVG